MKTKTAKTVFADLAKYPCHIEGCDVECMLPYPFCPQHNAMVPDGIMADAERHLTLGAQGVRGGYRYWRQDVCKAIDAVNALV